MSASEPRSWTQRRREQAPTTYPVLADNDPADVLRVDNWGFDNQQKPPTDFTRVATALGAYGGQQEDDTPNVDPWAPAQPEYGPVGPMGPSSPPESPARNGGYTSDTLSGFLGRVLEAGSRPAGAVAGALSADTPAGSVRGLGEGWQNPDISQFRDVGGVRLLPDNDVASWRDLAHVADPLGIARPLSSLLPSERNLSPRDIGGGIAAAGLDPLNLVPGIGNLDDLVRGSRAANRGLEAAIPRAASWLAAADQALTPAVMPKPRLGQGGAVDDLINPDRAYGTEPFATRYGATRADDLGQVAEVDAYLRPRIGDERLQTLRDFEKRQLAGDIYDAERSGRGGQTPAMAGGAPLRDVSKTARPNQQLGDDALAAIDGTPGAVLNPDGTLDIDLVRYQRPEQEGADSVRSGVFYMPEAKSPYERHFKAGAPSGYGGAQRVQQRRNFQDPLLVQAAAGGKAPEAAYDYLKGKKAYEAMRDDVMKNAMPSYYDRSSMRGTGAHIDKVSEVLARYGVDPDEAAYIIQNSPNGNQLPYAIQERIVAQAVKDAGYDGVIGYSKRLKGAGRLTEVFDVRESTYPTPHRQADLGDFYRTRNEPPSGGGRAPAVGGGSDLPPVTQAEVEAISARLKASGLTPAQIMQDPEFQAAQGRLFRNDYNYEPTKPTTAHDITVNLREARNQDARIASSGLPPDSAMNRAIHKMWAGSEEGAAELRTAAEKVVGGAEPTDNIHRAAASLIDQVNGSPRGTYYRGMRDVPLDSFKVGSTVDVPLAAAADNQVTALRYTEQGSNPVMLVINGRGARQTASAELKEVFVSGKYRVEGVTPASGSRPPVVRLRQVEQFDVPHFNEADFALPPESPRLGGGAETPSQEPLMRPAVGSIEDLRAKWESAAARLERVSKPGEGVRVNGRSVQMAAQDERAAMIKLRAAERRLKAEPTAEAAPYPMERPDPFNQFDRPQTASTVAPEVARIQSELDAVIAQNAEHSRAAYSADTPAERAAAVVANREGLRQAAELGRQLRAAKAAPNIGGGAPSLPGSQPFMRPSQPNGIPEPGRGPRTDRGNGDLTRVPDTQLPQRAEEYRPPVGAAVERGAIRGQGPRIVQQPSVPGAGRGGRPDLGNPALTKPNIPEPMIKEPRLQQALRIIGDIGNIPRTIQSSIDLSGSVRQAGFLAPRHYREWKNAMGAQMRSLVSEDASLAIQRELDTRPGATARKEAGLYQADWNGTEIGQREEQFASAMAGNLPGVKQTSRAYAVMLNKYRADVFDNIASKWTAAEQTPDRMAKLARYVEAATGRGSLPEFLKDAAPVMNAAFFSPRFMMSIPQRHLAALTTDPLMRNVVVKDLAAFYGTGLTILGSLVAAKQVGLLPGVEVNLTDYQSPDWGKVKVGNTRFDIWGGHQQFARMMARAVDATPEYAAAIATGNLDKVKAAGNPLGIMTQFMRYKFSPVANTEEMLRTGKTAIGGKPPAAVESAIRLVTPLLLQDLYDAYSVGGAGAAAMTLPSAIGLGVGTYADTPSGGSGGSGANPFGGAGNVNPFGAGAPVNPFSGAGNKNPFAR